MRAYADYLRHAAACHRLPVPLNDIRRHFSLPVYRRQLLEQRGFTTGDLRIYLNTDDRETVQKFTLAHEFMELLFFALEEGVADDWMADTLFTEMMDRKEVLCETGAAELVMPLDLFVELVHQQRVCVQSASMIAARCQVSLMATLWRIIETGLAPMVLIIWRYTHSPKEYVPSRAGQGNLFGPPECMDPPKKMRVERALLPPDFQGRIPRHKSVPLTSLIHRAFDQGTATSGTEDLDLVNLRGRYFVEALPFHVDGERRVMTLIHTAL